MNDSDRNPNELSPWRVLKYVGGGIAITGILMFFSVFISAALNVGNFDGFDNFAARGRSMALRGVFGMLMIIGGSVLGGIAALQGRNAGGRSGPSNDGTWSFGSEKDLVGPVKIRCPKCRALNDEAAKFCDQCGAEL